MNTKIKRMVALIGGVAMIAMSLAGCGGGKQTTTETEDANTLTYWHFLNGNVAQTATSLGETEFAKELMERTGIKIKYLNPSAGQGGEAFSILCASESLPDIIECSWDVMYPGGGTKALADGLIKEIDIEKDAPNLNAYLNENSDIRRMITTPEGKYFGYPFIRGDKSLLVYIGSVVRADWMDELGLSVPETIDEWTTMLRAFKEKKNAVAPLTITLNDLNTTGIFSGAYNTYYNLYLKDGKVTFGPLEDNYKEYLTQMNAWYEEGLLDADFITADDSVCQSNILNNICGATMAGGATFKRWISAANIPGFDLEGVKYPVLEKGSKPMYSQYSPPVIGAYAVISRDCKNPELAAKLLDYGYSEEGHMLFNFGIEGESYTMIDGYPTYTEKITNDPDGLSMSAAMARYCMSHGSGVFVQDKRYYEQFSGLPQAQEALKLWGDTDVEKYVMPALNLTDEQEKEMASIEESLLTYRDRMQAKFIMGEESLSNYDEFIKGLKERGIDKYIKYHQEAYERYMRK